jgi:hypothetical protein
MSNNRQIQTNTPNPDEGNKFIFKGNPKYFFNIKTYTKNNSGCNR